MGPRRYVNIFIEANPNCPEGCSQRFQAVGEPRTVRRIRITPRTRFLSVAAIRLAGAALGARAADGPKAEAPKTPWKIVGQLEEACSCNAACPCWFGSKPTRMTCGGGQFIFIEKGTYGDVTLNGLAVGSMVQSPAGQSMMDSFGKWNFNYFYIHAKANPDQRDALKALAKEVLVGEASLKTEVR